MTFEARSASRRWIRVTLLANRVRKVASSTAVSPPPTTRDLLAPVEGAVAGGAGAQAVAHVVHLACRGRGSGPRRRWRRSGRRRCSRRSRPPGRVGSVEVVTRNGRRERSTAVTRLEPAVGAELLGLPPHDVHEVGAEDPVGEAGEVLDGGRPGELAPRLAPLEDQRGEVGPGRCRARRSGRRTPIRSRSRGSATAHRLRKPRQGCRPTGARRVPGRPGHSTAYRPSVATGPCDRCGRGDHPVAGARCNHAARKPTRSPGPADRPAADERRPVTAATARESLDQAVRALRRRRLGRRRPVPGIFAARTATEDVT